MDTNSNRGRSSGGSTTNPKSLVERVKNLTHMADLKPEEFAEENGLADEFARQVKDLNSTQLRRFFHEIKNLKLQFKTSKFDRARIAMLMPMLAYAKGRKVIPAEFYDLMKECFGSHLCQTIEDFNRAVDLFEAILAYHKVYARK